MNGYNGDPAKSPSNPLWRLFTYIQARGDRDRPTTGECAHYMGVDRLTVRNMLKRLDRWVGSASNPAYEQKGKIKKGADPNVWQALFWKSDNDPFPKPRGWKPGGDSMSDLAD